ncbi:hypothetical protein [Propionicimonas sp.]|uniref:hypothetical protein n=1 Tax=Propionicimonas sp. TaxID=1955623 RepID=UPI001D83422B|nr:hypothetical protein [Propionicimonas sp.]MBU3976507.1 hypothetical protein [Actinomycetota bacterium]MBU3987339.1 hypothetical protein [Actinomycetota bacterium]MBU4007651.1 hypothetical protein [Actinomycetota bacterium]MBU4064432.1 hypothetical protein [Actinomycetota bacterium]MBU4092165.1 hypothetical protein [Actinomycetota bacterium]
MAALVRRGKRIRTTIQADWYNTRRVHGTLGMVSPLEYETTHYTTLNPEPQPA